jgi:NADH:flavin oxidoreductase / NADH oxidase family
MHMAIRAHRGIYTPDQIAGWRAVTDAVHARGGRIVMQIAHKDRVVGITMFCTAIEGGTIKRAQRMSSPDPLDQIWIRNEKPTEGNCVCVLFFDRLGRAGWSVSSRRDEGSIEEERKNSALFNASLCSRLSNLSLGAKDSTSSHFLEPP